VGVFFHAVCRATNTRVLQTLWGTRTHERNTMPVCPHCVAVIVGALMSTPILGFFARWVYNKIKRWAEVRECCEDCHDHDPLDPG